MIDFSPLLDPNLSLHMLHVFGVIIALGAVLVTDAVNALMHLNPKRANYTAKTAPVFSLMIWIGFLIISVTGLFMFLSRPTLILDRMFQVKFFLVGVIFLNGVFLNLWVTPKFDELSDEWSERTDRVKNFEKVAGLSAAISAIGWTTVFVLGYLLVNA